MNGQHAVREAVGALADAFTVLYHRFLLRDIMGKVLPGLLVILVWIHGRNLEGPPQWLVVAVIVTGAWLVGFMLQCPLEIGSELLGQHRKTAIYRDLIEFWHRASVEDQRQRERLVVIKEGCGNASMALIVGGALAWRSEQIVASEFAWVLCASAALFVMFLLHGYRDRRFREAVLNEPAEPANGGRRGDNDWEDDIRTFVDEPLLANVRSRIHDARQEYSRTNLLALLLVGLIFVALCIYLWGFSGWPVAARVQTANGFVGALLAVFSFVKLGEVTLKQLDVEGIIGKHIPQAVFAKMQRQATPGARLLRYTALLPAGALFAVVILQLALP